MTTKLPCTRHCCLNDKDICIGCYRSLQEILDWHTRDDSGKERIVNRASMRKNRAYKAAYGVSIHLPHPKLP